MYKYTFLYLLFLMINNSVIGMHKPGRVPDAIYYDPATGETIIYCHPDYDTYEDHDDVPPLEPIQDNMPPA